VEATEGFVQRAVSCKRGGMPAETFVQIWKCISRPNICAPPLREAATPKDEQLKCKLLLKTVNNVKFMNEINPCVYKKMITFALKFKSIKIL